MRSSGLFLIFVTSLCLASSCPNPALRQAAIGGDTITGFVSLHDGPLKFAPVRLYFSSGKTAWHGQTDKDGMFTIAKIPPGHYRLVVRGWGRTMVQLNPELDKKFIQTPVWNLSLEDDECVSVGFAIG
ncbi:MAG: carboxypeptidase-like regulatory domain-containing protein [Candidatus Sulfotelmatobacter sp.]|jgi:hypothetical protein